MAHAWQPLLRRVPRTQQTAFVCQSCRYQLQAHGSAGAISIQRRHASNRDLPATEKIRRMIWGTDNPPGLKDPYGGPSFLEKRRMRKDAEQQAQLEEAELQPTPLQPARTADGAAEHFTAVNTVMEKYRPAQTWDGLQRIGHTGDWKDLAPSEADDFTAWTASTTAPKTQDEVGSARHQALVECLACQHANLDPLHAGNQPDIAAEQFAAVRLVPGESTNVSDVISSKDQLEDIATSFEQAVLDEQAATPEAGADAADHIFYSLTDTAFLSLHLDVTHPFTFAILRRFSQIIGHRIPDPVLSSAMAEVQPKSLTYLVDQMFERSVKPTPKRLAERLLADRRLDQHPNIRILSKRETLTDRETDLGRWKVIEQELTRRGLPLKGRDGALNTLVSR